MRKFLFLFVLICLNFSGCECYHDRTGCDRTFGEILDDEINGEN